MSAVVESFDIVLQSIDRKTKVSFTATPEHCRLMLSVWDEFYRVVEARQLARMPCAQCGVLVDHTSSTTPFEHGKAICTLAAGNKKFVDLSFLDTVVFRFVDGEIRMRWFDCMLNVPCKSNQECCLLRDAKEQLANLLRQHASPNGPSGLVQCRFESSGDSVAPSRGPHLASLLTMCEQMAIPVQLSEEPKADNNMFFNWVTKITVDAFRMPTPLKVRMRNALIESGSPPQ